MRAVLYTQFLEPPSVREVADPACPADGVVVRVEATGLCRSDWHGWQGHDPDIVVPHVPGHGGVVRLPGATAASLKQAWFALSVGRSSIGAG